MIWSYEALRFPFFYDDRHHHFVFPALLSIQRIHHHTNRSAVLRRAAGRIVANLFWSMMSDKYRTIRKVLILIVIGQLAISLLVFRTDAFALTIA